MKNNIIYTLYIRAGSVKGLASGPEGPGSSPQTATNFLNNSSRQATALHVHAPVYQAAALHVHAPVYQAG